MRLIDADALLKIYKNWLPQLIKPEDAGDRNGVETCIAVLEYAPTIDAEPVVRCKDCVYYRPEPYGDVMMCYEFANGYWPHPDDYCSRGKRKEVEVQDEI